MDDDKKESSKRPGHAELVTFETELVSQIIKGLDSEAPPSRPPEAEVAVEEPSPPRAAGAIEDSRGEEPRTGEERPQYQKAWYGGIDRRGALPGVPVSVMSAIGEPGRAEAEPAPIEEPCHEPVEEACPAEPVEEACPEPVEGPLGLPPPEDELVRDYVEDERAEEFDEIVEQSAPAAKGRDGAVVSAGKQVAILPRYFEEAFELDLAPSIKNLEYLMIGALVVSCLVTMLALLRLGGGKAFPILAEGGYVGKILGLGDGKDEGTGFYLESVPGDRYLFVIARPEWGSQLLDFSNETRSAGGIAPVTLVNPRGSIQFVGHELASGRYGGKLLGANGRVRGEWRLSAISEPPGEHPAPSVEHTKAWHGMRVALDQLARRISTLEPSIARQDREIARLTDFITEEEKLKKRADEKYDAMKSELASLERTLSVKRKEARVLERQFDVSQRVKGLGRLVSLARDSLQREAEWIEIMEGSVTGEYPRDFEEAYRRGLKIQEVKRQIAKENERIAALGKQAKASPPSPALATREDGR